MKKKTKIDKTKTVEKNIKTSEKPTKPTPIVYCKLRTRRRRKKVTAEQKMQKERRRTQNTKNKTEEGEKKTANKKGNL